MNPGPYVKSLVPAIVAVLYSLESWVLTGHLDALHVRESLFGLAIAAVVYWLPNTPPAPEPPAAAEPPAPIEPMRYATGGYVAPIEPMRYATGGYVAPTTSSAGILIAPESPPGTTLRAVR